MATVMTNVTTKTSITITSKELIAMILKEHGMTRGFAELEIDNLRGDIDDMAFTVIVSDTTPATVVTKK